MDESELLALIEKDESQTVEFKESLSLKDDIGEAVSAFSNCNDGLIFVGVSDKREIVGVQVGKRTLEDLANYLKTHTDNHVFPRISVESIGGKKIVLIAVSESKERPVFFKGRAYGKVGKSVHKLSASEIRKLAKESGERVYWDSQACEGAKPEDIDEQKVEWFVNEAKKQRGLSLPASFSVKKALARLNLLKDGKLVNAALLLFPKRPWFLQSEIKCIRFSGDEPVKPYIDFQTLDGSIFDMIDRAEDFVLRNVRRSVRLVPAQVQREEKFEYPPDAIREAIVNAIVHRDYDSPSKVQVRVFDGRIEIWSPGLLPESIGLDDLRKEHRSIPRNPLLFKQLFWVKYVEDVGGGTLDMIRQCKEWGVLEPEFKMVTGAFVVVFRLPPTPEDLEKSGLNERQVKAVAYAVKKGFVGNKEYQVLNSISKRIATLELADLVKRGIFARVGTGKRGLKYVFLAKKYPKSIQKSIQKVSKRTMKISGMGSYQNEP